METIYDWLLKNMGNAHVRENETHYVTILNVQRETNQAGIPTLDIMVRTDDFSVLNLLIHPAAAHDPSSPDPNDLKGRTFRDSYFLSDEQQVIVYLMEGETVESERVATGSAGFRLFILEPANGLGDITFPPSAPVDDKPD